MANLVLPYPDFVGGTKIKSAEVDANFAAIATKINGALNPDNLAYPFLGTGQIGADKTGTATSGVQGYNSYDVILRGSGWDGAAAQDRDIILRQIITGASAYRLALIKKEAAVETELFGLDSTGKATITGGSAAQAVTQIAVLNTTVGGYGSGISFLAKRSDTSAVLEQAKITADGELAWNSDANTSSALRFYTVNANVLAEKMRILPNGNVGVGTTNPPQKLSIAGTSVATNAAQTNISAYASNGIRIDGDAASSQDAITYQAAGGGGAAIAFMRDGSWGTCIDFYTNAAASQGAITRAMSINSIGNVGINNPSPGARLQIDTGAAATIGQIIKGYAGQTADLQQWQDSAGTVKASISANGNLTVNGTAYPLVLFKNTATDALVTIDAANTSAANAASLKFLFRGATRSQLYSDYIGQDLLFYVATGAAGSEAYTESFRILNTTGDIQMNRFLRWIAGNTQTTVGAAGAASALPANPVGYAKIQVGATTYVVPYYNAA